MPELFAILASVTFAFNHVLAKKGMALGTSPFVGVIINIGTNSIILWLIQGFISSYSLIASRYIIYFIIIGVLTPGIARFFFFLGADRIGVSRTSTITGTTPIYSVLLAIIFLGEQPRPLMAVGTAMTVFGIILVSLGRDRKAKWRKRDMIFPFSAAIVFAIRDVIARYALAFLPAPVLGAAVASTTAFVLLGTVHQVKSRKEKYALNRRSVKYFIVSGLFAGFSYAFVYSALQIGRVIKVAPINYTIPLFVVLFTYLFLGDIERITKRIITGAAVVVAGVILVTIS